MKLRIIFALMMSMVLGVMMTGWVTWLNLGWDEQFFSNWMRAFVSAWPMAATISFLSARRFSKPQRVSPQSSDPAGRYPPEGDRTA